MADVVEPRPVQSQQGVDTDEDDGEDERHDDHADDVARRVDAEARTRAVIAELEKLPAGDREVLEMSAWSDLSQAQIALVLGIPVGTVKSRLARAQRTVRGALVEEAL